MVWQYLGEQIKDDEGTAPGAKPTNRSNRFEMANQINALLSSGPKMAGPFWCASSEAAYLYIPQTRPPEPFQTAQGYTVEGLRLTDKRARSGSPFRLFGTASVGSQSLTGIARLYQLRNDPELAPVSAVWPFETGWATKAKWLPNNVSILHAEIRDGIKGGASSTDPHLWGWSVEGRIAEPLTACTGVRCQWGGAARPNRDAPFSLQVAPAPAA